MNVIAISKCPECGSPTLDHDNNKGEVTCFNCGLVVDDKMIRIEIPYNDSEDGGGRDGVGAPQTSTDPTMGLQTNIGSYADLRKLSFSQRKRYKRLGIWQRRTSSNVEKNFKIALPEIKRVVSSLNLTPRIEEEAARLYREATFKGISKGRPIEVVVAASVYAACRIQGIPVSLLAIQKAYLFEKKEIGKTFRLLSRILGLKINPQEPIDYIPRICGKLAVSPKVQTQAVEILIQSNKHKFMSGKSPMSLAAAAVHLSCMINKERRIQADIARASDITEVTLRNRYQELMNVMDLTPEKIKKMRMSAVR